MKSTAFHIVRVGTGITFVWIGVLILRDPAAWGRVLQPWAVGLIGAGSLREAMLLTAGLDILVGLALLTDLATFWAASLGFLHLANVIIVVGITPVTTRDIAIAAGLLALVADSWPAGWRLKERTGGIDAPAGGV